MDPREATRRRRRKSGATAASGAPPVFLPARDRDLPDVPPDGRTPLVREIDAAADYLRYVRRELAALGANEMAKGQIPAALRELHDVMEDSTHLADAVMTAAEEVIAGPAQDAEVYRAFVAERMTAMMVQCAMQDVAAQRARRIQIVLQTMERRLARLATFVATREMPEIVDLDLETPAEPADATSPALDRRNDQAAVDGLLAGRERDGG